MQQKEDMGVFSEEKITDKILTKHSVGTVVTNSELSPVSESLGLVNANRFMSKHDQPKAALKSVPCDTKAISNHLFPIGGDSLDKALTIVAPTKVSFSLHTVSTDLVNSPRTELVSSVSVNDQLTSLNIQQLQCKILENYRLLNDGKVLNGCNRGRLMGGKFGVSSSSSVQLRRHYSQALDKVQVPANSFKVQYKKCMLNQPFKHSLCTRRDVLTLRCDRNIISLFTNIHPSICRWLPVKGLFSNGDIKVTVECEQDSTVKWLKNITNFSLRCWMSIDEEETNNMLTWPDKMQAQNASIETTYDNRDVGSLAVRETSTPFTMGQEGILVTMKENAVDIMDKVVIEQDMEEETMKKCPETRFVESVLVTNGTTIDKERNVKMPETSGSKTSIMMQENSEISNKVQVLEKAKEHFLENVNAESALITTDAVIEQGKNITLEKCTSQVKSLIGREYFTVSVNKEAAVVNENKMEEVVSEVASYKVAVVSTDLSGPVTKETTNENVVAQNQSKYVKVYLKKSMKTPGKSRKTDKKTRKRKASDDTGVPSTNKKKVLGSESNVRSETIRLNSLVAELAELCGRAINFKSSKRKKKSDQKKRNAKKKRQSTSKNTPGDGIGSTGSLAAGTSRFGESAEKSEVIAKKKRKRKRKESGGLRKSKRRQKINREENNAVLKENAPVQLYSEELETFDTWDSWFRKIMSMKSMITAKELLSEKILRCFYKCMDRHCIFATDDAETFVEHLVKSHPGENTFYCSFCFRTFGTVEHLVWHVTSAHGTRRYQCSGCPYRASSRRHLDFHCNDFHDADYFRCQQPSSVDYCLAADQPKEPREVKHYKCTINGCLFSSVITRAYFEHAHTKHRDSETFPCGYCSFETVVFSQILLHYREHDVHELECAHCNYGSSKPSKIIRHLCLTHPDQNFALFSRGFEEESSSAENRVPEFIPNYARNLSCVTANCLFKAWNVSAYRNHLSTVHPHLRNCLPCPHCSRIMKTAQEFEEHVYMHGPNLYRCNHCGFLHWQVRMLSDHFLREHGVVKCQLVVIRQLQDSSLAPIATLMASNEPSDEDDDDSIVVVDGDKDQPAVVPDTPTPHVRSTSRSFVCSLCDTVILYKKDLLIHYRQKHLYRQVVQCNSCRELFSSKAVLDLHLRLHHNKQPSEILNVATESSGVKQCFACKYKTNNSYHMREHLFSEIDYSPFRCTVCSIGCRRRSFIIQHCSSVHHDSSCWVQKVDRRTESWVNDFMAKAGAKDSLEQLLSPDGSYLCVYCRKGINSFRRYRFHLFRHLQYKRYSCKQCNIEFFGKSSARKHSTKVHGTILKHAHSSLRLPLLEKWVNSAERSVEENTGTPSEDLDLSRVYFRLPKPSKVERVPVSDGLKLFNMDVKVKVERIDDFGTL